MERRKIPATVAKANKSYGEVDVRMRVEDKSPLSGVLRGTSLYMVIVLVQRSLSILLMPVYTRYLSPTDYGILELLDLISQVFSLILVNRLGLSLFYFFHEEDSQRSRSRYVTTALFGATVVGGIAILIVTLIGGLISRLVFGTDSQAHLIRLSVIGLAAAMPMEIGYCYLRATNRHNIFTRLSLLRLACGVVLNLVLLVVIGLGVSSMLWSALVSAVILSIFSSWFVLAENYPSFDFMVLIRMILYCFPLAIGAVGDFALHFGDRIFLRGAVPLSELGIYTLACKLGMLVYFLSNPFFGYWNSQMVRVVKQPGGDSAYARAATYLLLGLTGLTVMLTAFINPLMRILTTPDFYGAAIYVPWIAIAYLIRMMGNFWSNTFLLEGRTGSMAKANWIGASVCIICYIFLIPRFGLWGAIVATQLGFVSMASYSFCMSQKIRRFEYEYGRWGLIIGCGLVSTIPVVIVRAMGLFQQISLGFSCAGIFVGLLWLMRFPTDGELRVLSGAIDGLWRRIFLMQVSR